MTAPSPAAPPTAPPPTRVIAVDWSGARLAREQRRNIWLGEALPATDDAPPRLVRLEDGRSRDETAAHLIAEAARDPRLVVGLDFSFSLPAWFLAERALPDAPALWALAAAEGERWLGEGAPPFWGRAGTRRPAGRELLRRTERDVRERHGFRPSSTFQVGGAGAVGTASVRGMPVLHRLRAAGFRVWPFDAPHVGAAPCVVEIYPRLLTGAVNKSSASARIEYLRTRLPSLPAELGVKAASSDDAFDAAVSAVAMAAHAAAWTHLDACVDDVRRLEGEIWQPPAATP